MHAIVVAAATQPTSPAAVTRITCVIDQETLKTPSDARMRQRLYLNDNEIGKSVLPLWMLMEQKPWGKQYTTSLGLCHGRATLTFRLQLFAFPDNSSPPLSTPLHALEKLEKRFGKEITLLDNIQPPANVLGFLQVNNPPRPGEPILSSYRHRATWVAARQMYNYIN